MSTYTAIIAIIASMTLSCPAIAANTAAPQEKREKEQSIPEKHQVKTPVASHTENPAFNYSARKMLGYVSEARVALQNENKDEAVNKLNASLEELNAIRNTRNYLEMSGIRFGRVLYGENNMYYIPIADDTYAVRTYTRGPFWSPKKATAVRDVELVNVNIAINPEKALNDLQTARQNVLYNDFRMAEKNLKDLLDESLRETHSTSQPLTRLQDNVYLARILIRQENYEGARYTLRHAKSALNDYEKVVTTPEQRQNINSFYREIAEMDKTLAQRDPELIDRVVDKLEEWWKKWSKEK